MIHCVCFTIKKNVDVDNVWAELSAQGVDVLYSVEDPSEGNQIYAYLKNDELPNLSGIESAKYVELSIDWESQWAIHGFDFHDGLVHIDLSAFGYKKKEIVCLKAGPGFGDLSHPTTRLMLKMMAQFDLTDKYIVDIGSGSGVLSLCAIAMGARFAYGIDIDPNIITHAQTNAEINDMKDKTMFDLAETYHPPTSIDHAVLLMNMISSEQQTAWKSLPQIHKLKGEIITSGVLKEESKEYLKRCKSWGWNLHESIEDEGWMCFRLATMSIEH